MTLNEEGPGINLEVKFLSDKIRDILKREGPLKPKWLLVHLLADFDVYMYRVETGDKRLEDLLDETVNHLKTDGLITQGCLFDLENHDVRIVFSLPGRTSREAEINTSRINIEADS